jgi:hypothetical protein
MNIFIKHVAGHYDGETRMQICSLCGAVLWDNNGIMWLDGDGPPSGWALGKDVYVSDDASGRLRTILIGDSEKSIPCTL